MPGSSGASRAPSSAGRPGPRSFLSWPAKVVAIGLLGAAAMLPGISGVSLWTDEAATISAATRSVPELLRMARTVDAVHLVYYLAMHEWTTVFGTSPAALRVPSALAVGLTSSGLALLTRRWAGETTALLAALVYVVLPRVTWMGIEARPFALTAAMAVYWCLAFVHARGADRYRTAWWTVVACLGGLAVATNLYLALLLPVQAAVTILDRPDRRGLFRHAVAALGTLLLSAPVVWVAVHQTGQIGSVPRGALTWVRVVAVNQWFLGDSPTAGSSTDLALAGWEDAWKPSAVLLALLCWFVIVATAVRSGRATGRSLEATILLSGWVVFPTLALVAYASLTTPLYNPRYLSFCAPAVAGLLAMAMASWRRRTYVALLVLVVLLSLPVYASQRTVNAKSGSDWSEIAGYLGAHRDPGDGVYFSPRYPPTRAEVGLTTRFVSVAYPLCFEGMPDVTLKTSPVQSGDLLGRSRLLADSRSQLENLTAVWVVRRNDYPVAPASADDEILRSAGFTRVEALVGPVDSVARWSKP